MTAAAFQNIGLTRYLIGQVLQSPEARLDALKEFVPLAKMEDWKLEAAGQRVQVIKKDPAARRRAAVRHGGHLRPPTARSRACLGASPGASTTAVSIMLKLIGDCFPARDEDAALAGEAQGNDSSYGESLIGKRRAGPGRISAWTRDVLVLREESRWLAN